MRRIGIDVGGTNTDAVIIEDGRVVAAAKTPTTEDVTGGVVQTLAELTLVLVLFTDASRIDLSLLRRQNNLPMRLLGL